MYELRVFNPIPYTLTIQPYVSEYCAKCYPTYLQQKKKNGYYFFTIRVLYSKTISLLFLMLESPSQNIVPNNLGSICLVLFQKGNNMDKTYISDY